MAFGPSLVPNLYLVSVGVVDVSERKPGRELAPAEELAADALDLADRGVDVARFHEPEPEVGDAAALPAPVSTRSNAITS